MICINKSDGIREWIESNLIIELIWSPYLTALR